MRREDERTEWEKEFSAAGYRLEFPQDSDGARRERNAVRTLHLHLFGRYRPDGRVQIELGPLGRAKLAGPHESQGASNSSAARVSGAPS
jgi:hypothetical protein